MIMNPLFPKATRVISFRAYAWFSQVEIQLPTSQEAFYGVDILL